MNTLQVKRRVAASLIGLAAAATLTSNSAEAITSGFSGFHVQAPVNGSENPYECISEDNGAVVNKCTYAVSLVFAMPYFNLGEKSFMVKNYWGGTAAEESFNCQVFWYYGNQSLSAGSTEITFTAGSQQQNGSFNLGNFYPQDLQLICWNIPAGGGVAMYDYTP